MLRVERVLQAAQQSSPAKQRELLQALSESLVRHSHPTEVNGTIAPHACDT